MVALTGRARDSPTVFHVDVIHQNLEGAAEAVRTLQAGSSPFPCTRRAHRRLPSMQSASALPRAHRGIAEWKGSVGL